MSASRGPDESRTSSKTRLSSVISFCAHSLGGLARTECFVLASSFEPEMRPMSLSFLMTSRLLRSCLIMLAIIRSTKSLSVNIKSEQPGEYAG